MPTSEDVIRIARLARLRLDPDELNPMQEKFNRIFEAFASLNEVDTHGIEPVFHATEAMALRADVPEAPLAREDLLANAPDSFEGSFRIPRVVGGEE